ncbi:alpha/beta-hydrolase [Pluteus cervinus]|uniref:Alpha/beta-hydrolase n=1 Tax=Pluteus cervinus TaxID=181527 RepID=A0ACD3B6L7_9AGAR|nr:alpha/beta-hydrolase [Pluteus cervinus]
MVSHPLQCLTFSLLILPPLILSTYFLAAFPKPPEPLYMHSSLASLPKTSKTWEIYPEDFYPNGAYVAFPSGRVRYWLLGPEEGRKIVLIHGLSIPAMIWKNIAPELASRGYRVLLYDLYGRGYSDAPQTTYDANLYVTQLALLMQYLKWDRALITGVSMGGGIAAAFTGSFPHLVEDQIVLIASAGLIETNDLPRTAKFMSSPLVQTVAASAPVRKYLQGLINSTHHAEKDQLDPIIVRMQSAHLPGYNAALSSSLRDGPIRGQAAALSSTGFKNRKVLLIHGTKDQTVFYKYASKILETLPPETQTQSQLVTVEDGGHDLTITHSDLIVQNLLAFYAGPKPTA